MKLGFICLNLPGHLNPMTTLARHLQARNHDVVFLYSSGAAGLPLRLWPEIEKVPQSMLKYWRTPTPESERMRRAPDSMSIGTTHPPQSRSWPGLPNVLGNLILKVRMGHRSSITPAHSMMAWAGRSWISPASD